MALDDVSYRPIPTFADWMSMLGTEPDWTGLDSAVQRLGRTRELIGPPDAEVSARESLLLAALHTGAIEGIHRMNRGITLTAIDHVTDWQRYVEDAEGSDARRHIEAALGAYDLAVDAARADALPVSEAWLRRVHEVACAAQDTVIVRTAVGEQRQPFRRGEYKRASNHVLLGDGRMLWFAPPDEVVAEMRGLIEGLRTADFAAAHPVLQASFAHHALTHVHPFQDGNGRVARVLASVPLLRWASVPFHLYEDQVADYLDALAAADAGKPTGFVSFVRERVHDLVLLTDDRLVAAAPVELPADREQDLAVATTRRLSEAVGEQLQAILDDYRWPRGANATLVELGPKIGRVDQKERQVLAGRQQIVRLDHADSGGQVIRVFQIYTKMDLRGEHPFAVEETMVGTGSLELRLSDVHPEVRMSARARLDAYLRRAIRDGLQELRVRLGGT